jgi:hypothetical protein
MKIPKVKVESVVEYFNLPEKEREYFGFYKIPHSLPFEFFSKEVGWDNFNLQIKKNYPIQWFFRQFIFSYENPIYKFIDEYVKKPISNFFKSLILFLKPCCLNWRKTLKRYEYSDVSELAVKSNFNLILDFYEQSFKFEKNHIDSNIKFFTELSSNVDWIKKKRKEKISEITKHFLDSIVNEKNKDELIDKLEKDLENKDTEILKWFIENRGYFWV